MAINFLNNPKVGDNVKIEIGSSSDLQIYHDGSNSYIVDSGTGNLNINATNLALNNGAGTKTYILATDNGSVQLRHNDSTKLETTSTGVNIFDTLKVGTTGVAGGKIISGDSMIFQIDSDNNSTTSSYRFRTNGTADDGTELMRIQENGNVGIGTTAPGSKLTVVDNSYQILLIDTSTSNRAEISVEDSAFGFYADRAASTADTSFFWSIDDTNRMEINLLAGGEGQLRLNDYGPGNITGTAEFILGVDSNGNVIETSAGGSGTVTGSGVATRVAFWSSTSALSSDANLYWDNTNDRLGIGTTTPGAKLEIFGTGNSLRLDSAANGSKEILFRNVGTGTATIKTDGDLKLYAEDANKNILFETNGGEAMRINSAGNVGIGTTSPTSLFQTKLETTFSMGISNEFVSTYVSKLKLGRVGISSVSSMEFVYDIANQEFGSIKRNYTGSSLKFERGTTLDMIIDGSGKVGIGTTSPAHKLDVQVSGNVARFGDGTRFFRIYTDSDEVSLLADGSVPMKFYTSGSEKMRIDSAGLVSIKNTGVPTLRLDNTDTSLAAQTLGSLEYYQNDPSGTGVGAVSRINAVNESGFQGEAALTFQTGTASSIAERMRITSAGNVIIGQTSFATGLSNITQLEASGATAGGIVINTQTASTSNYSRLIFTKGNAAGNEGLIRYNTGDYHMSFWTDATEKMRIDSAGAMQFGTGTNNGGFLDFDGTSVQINTQRNPNTGVFVDTAKSNASINLVGASGGSYIRFNTASANNTTATERIRINSAGNVGIGTTAPSQKLQVEGNSWIKGIYYDTSGDAGSSGQVLSSTASGTNWVSAGGTSGFAPMVKFNRSGINSSTYTMIATVNGNNLASIIQMTMTGTSGNVVFACTFDITVNHSQDIHVKSMNGDYSEVTLRITSNNNEDYSIEAKHNGSTSTTAEVCIFPLADEIITPTTTDPGYTGAEYEHTAVEGWRFGGEDGNVESSNVIIDGNVGIGTSSPTGDLSVGSTTTSSGDIHLRTSKTTVTLTPSNTAAGGFDIDTGFVSGGQGPMTLSIGGSEKMRITSAGNVGIGITSPGTYKLNVAGTGYYSNQLTVDGFTNDAGISFRNGFSPTNVGVRAKAIGTGNRDGLELLGYNGIDFSVNNGANLAMRIVGVTGSGVGNVGIGTTSPSALLEVAGSALLQKSFYQTMPNQDGTANRGGYIARPKGGDFISSTSSQTGSLEIQIPTGGSGRDDMIKFVIDIYEYGTNRSLTVFVGGYIYQGIGGTTWLNCSAQIIGSTASDNYTVRFGDNDNVHCVWIGETSETWSYPQVIVRDFYGGFITNVTEYLGDWDIDFVSSQVNVSQTLTNNFPLSSGGASGAFLPLSGGTLTGDLILNEQTPLVILKDSGGTTPTNTQAYVSMQKADGTEVAFMGMGSGSNNILYLYGSTGTTINIATNATNAMFIDSSQKVGIGTTNPNRRLHVSEASNGNIALFTNTVDADLNINLTSGVALLTPSTGILAFGTSSTERMRIDSTGKVGIGTGAVVDANLHVVGTDIKLQGVGIAGDLTFAYNAGNNSTTVADVNYANINATVTSGSTGSESGKLSFQTRNSGTVADRMTIHADGQVEFKKGAAQIKITDTDDNKFAEISYSSSFLSLRNNTTTSTHFVLDTSGRVGIGTTSPVSTWLSGFDPSTGNGTFKLTSEGWIVTPYLTGLAAYVSGQGARPIIWSDNTGTNIQSWDNDSTDGISLKSSNGATRLFVKETGLVGIGKTNPVQKLDIVGNINIEGTGAYIRWNNGDMAIVNAGSYAMSFQTYNGSALTEVMRINSSGNLGIGITNASEKLVVSGNSITLSKTRGLGTNYATSEGWFEAAAGTINTMTGYFGGGFGRNGPAAENKIEYSIGPFNTSELVWMSVPETVSNDDGGWNKSMSGFNNSTNNGFMSVVYVRRDTGTASGNFYHGCSGSATNNLDGSANGNPYFCNFAISNLPLDIWCVSIGILYAANDGTTSGSPLTGTYRMDTGEKIHTGVTYRQKPSNSTQQQRVYHYYSTSPTAQLDFARPGFYITDGSEPTLSDLTAGAAGGDDVFWSASGNDIYNDNSGNVGIGTIVPSFPLEVNVTGNNTVFALTRDTGTNGELTVDFDGANANFDSLQGGHTFQTGGTERMKIDTAGNVKLAITNSTSNTVIGKDGSGMFMETSGSTNALSDMRFQARASGAGFYSTIKIKPSTQTLEFSTSSAQRMTIDSAGKVGIGTTSPTQKLQVDGNTQLGRNGNNLAGDPQKTIISGQGIEDAGTGNFYGSYGFLELNANTNYTGSARRFAITNGLLANRFAIIRSNSTMATMQLGVAGALPSGSSADFVISNVGNVGIGTTDPDTVLELEGADPLLKLSSSVATGNPYLQFAQAGTRRSFIQHVNSGDNLSLVSEYGGIRMMTGTSGTETEKMIIQSDGDVGIGVTNPVNKLQVAGKIYSSGDIQASSQVQAATLRWSATTTPLEQSGALTSSAPIDPDTPSGYIEIKVQTTVYLIPIFEKE